MSEWTRRDIDMLLYLLADIIHHQRIYGQAFGTMSPKDILKEARLFAIQKEQEAIA